MNRNEYRPTTRRNAAAAFAAALVFTFVNIGSVLALFDSASSPAPQASQIASL